MVLPTNLADGIAAARDGKLGVIEEIQISSDDDDLLVSALTGMFQSDSMIVTRKPIQAGFDMTDAAVRQPVDMSWDIVLTNPDYSAEGLLTAALTGNPGSLAETWRDKRDKLYYMFELRELLTVQSHEAVHNDMLIESITPIYDVDNNWDAFVGTINFIQIQTLSEPTGGLIDQAKQVVGGL